MNTMIGKIGIGMSHPNTIPLKISPKKLARFHITTSLRFVEILHNEMIIGRKLIASAISIPDINSIPVSVKNSKFPFMLFIFDFLRETYAVYG